MIAAMAASIILIMTAKTPEVIESTRSANDLMKRNRPGSHTFPVAVMIAQSKLV